ncbi:MAG: phage portal protein [Planctomycetia bacterium]|nr:phage portal protein [Planctomycetia bacterium]
MRYLRARYDAAVVNDDNRRHWANADGLSARAANSAEVRRILRNRSRYEVANNSYARGIVLTLANDAIGTGPRLQMLTDNAEANRRIEREFTAWAKAINLAERLRTMRVARAQDGEAFAVLTSNMSLPTAIQLDLRLIEAEQVATPDLNALVFNAVDGIVFDEAGNPVEYHVLKQHPGDAFALVRREFDRVPRASMIHWFRADRPGQARGIPDIMPALPLFAQLRRFTLAVLAAAETAADFAGILYTDAPANGEADAAEPFESIELEKRALLTMPGGWKMSQLQAEQPATTYAEFKREILNEIARCLNMPFNVAAGNSSGYNYASGRLDHQTYYKSIPTLAYEYARQGRDWEEALHQRAKEAALMQELGLSTAQAPPAAPLEEKSDEEESSYAE